MARFPVTNELFSGYTKDKGIKHPVKDWWGKKNHPVIHVSWKDAMVYCQWLNNLLKAELSSGLVLRLPSEAEWEKAARGTDGREYPWGNQFDKYKCNIYAVSKGKTTPVDLYSPQGDSPYGCADMSGNAYEWTHSLYKSYPYKIDDGREAEITSGRHVIRSSYLNTWHENGFLERCHRRSSSGDSGSERVIDLIFGIRQGFRIAMAPPFLER